MSHFAIKILFGSLFVLYSLAPSWAFLGPIDPAYSPARATLKQKTLRGHKSPTDYSFARKMLMTKVSAFEDHGKIFVRDVYCGQIVELKNSSSIPSDNVVNTEHTWPQSRFNQRANPAVQKADLHHLYPTNSKANGIRSSNVFTNVDSHQSVFPGCPDSKTGRSEEDSSVFGFEPPDKHKGNVARALFYFSVRYDINISKVEEDVLRRWNELDPVDEQEKHRNDLVESIQGNRNPFIDDAHAVDTLDDF